MSLENKLTPCKIRTTSSVLLAKDQYKPYLGTLPDPEENEALTILPWKRTSYPFDKFPISKKIATKSTDQAKFLFLEKLAALSTDTIPFYTEG